MADENPIRVVNDESIKRTYSNFVSVTTSPYECNITFCLIDPLEIEKGIASAKTVAKIAIPHSLVEETVGALKTNYENFMKKLSEKQK